MNGMSGTGLGQGVLVERIQKMAITPVMSVWRFCKHLFALAVPDPVLAFWLALVISCTSGKTYALGPTTSYQFVVCNVLQIKGME